MAFEARADERETRGFISMMMRRPVSGWTAHCTFDPPVSIPIASRTRMESSRIAWYSRSVSVWIGATVQWAVNPQTGRRIIIEMNPRVSRSSALASKATGFPIAKIAALLAVGYTLDELTNDITQVTPACFEPALDYVVVKVPRFTFEKFPGADKRLGTQMKSVGEAMAIGRTFKQAYLKAVRSLEAPLAGHDAASFDPWFKAQLDEIEAFREFLGRVARPARPQARHQGLMR